MQSYNTSRNIFSIMEFLAWSGVVLGAIFVLIGLSGLSPNPYGFGGMSPKVFFIVPGLVLLVYGLISVVIVQSARAQVDTAELTGQILRVARDQLEVSKQALRQSEGPQTRFEKLPRRETEGHGVDFGKSASRAEKANVGGGSLLFGGSLGNAPAAMPSELNDSDFTDVIEYGGRKIGIRGEYFIFDGKAFKSLIGAQLYIDRLAEDTQRSQSGTMAGTGDQSSPGTPPLPGAERPDRT